MKCGILSNIVSLARCVCVLYLALCEVLFLSRVLPSLSLVNPGLSRLATFALLWRCFVAHSRHLVHACLLISTFPPYPPVAAMATQDQTVLAVLDYDEVASSEVASSGRNLAAGSAARVHPLGVGADAKAAVRHHMSQVSSAFHFDFI